MRAPAVRAGAVLLVAHVCSAPLAAQGVLVDQGRFDVRIGGRSVGTEDFTIRRAGLGRDDALFANATVTLRVSGSVQEIRPLLRAAPPDGAAVEYQVQVSGTDALDLRLRRSGRRFTAVIRSAAGEEQREFPADAETRVLDADVAHQYYFLRDAREGSRTPVLEPRTRSRTELVASAPVDEELRSAQTVVSARRVDFSAGGDRRSVWFDRLGRVLRVEVPARGYVAERVDLMR